MDISKKSKLQNFKIISNNSKENRNSLQLYISALMRYSATPELRSYWAIVYKYLKVIW